MKLNYTVEELLLDESFVDYCLHEDSAHKSKWEQARQEYPGIIPVMDEARNWLLLLAPGLPPGEVKAEISKLQQLMQQRAALQETTLPVENESVVPVSRMPYRRLWLAVACVALLLLAGAWWWSGQSIQRYDANFAATEIWESPGGQRRQVVLPDGSEVILNANSRLEVGKDFNKNNRLLRLRGQAFFKVAHDASLPFIVHSGEFSTTALGTAFYVNARNLQQGYTVNLLEGKVKLQTADGASDLLLPGQQGAWRKTAKQFEKNSFDTSYLHQWVSGVLAFQQIESGQVFALLEQWYGLQIIDRRANPRHVIITGDYTGQPLEDILKAICFSLSCHFKQENDTIIIE